MGPRVSVLCKTIRATTPDGPEALVPGCIQKMTFAVVWLGITFNCISTLPLKTHFSL